MPIAISMNPSTAIRAPVATDSSCSSRLADRRPRPKRQPIVLEGDVPSPINPPEACRFHPRCPRFQPGKCDVDEPELYGFGEGHSAACHFPLERWPLTATEIRRPAEATQPVSSTG